MSKRGDASHPLILVDLGERGRAAFQGDPAELDRIELMHGNEHDGRVPCYESAWAKTNNATWVCTRPRHHEGDLHIAAIGSRIIGWWHNDQPLLARAPHHPTN